MYYLMVIKQDPHVVCCECLDIIPEDESVEIAPDSYLCFGCFEELTSSEEL